MTWSWDFEGKNTTPHYRVGSCVLKYWSSYSKLGVGFKYVLFSPRKLGKMNPIWLTLFRWVETVNHPTRTLNIPKKPMWDGSYYPGGRIGFKDVGCSNCCCILALGGVGILPGRVHGCKWLGWDPTIYKKPWSERPFGRGITPVRGLINHGYWLSTTY